jgi:hypothetical protein
VIFPVSPNSTPCTRSVPGVAGQQAAQLFRRDPAPLDLDHHWVGTFSLRHAPAITLMTLIRICKLYGGGAPGRITQSGQSIIRTSQSDVRFSTGSSAGVRSVTIMLDVNSFMESQGIRPSQLPGPCAR